MQFFSSILKRYFPSTFLTIGCLFLGGCGSYLTNVTPTSVKRNPSNLYRFSVVCNISPQHLVPDTLKPTLVIDGQQFPLQKEADIPEIYYYDHKLDETRIDAKYYFQVSYRQRKQGKIKDYTRKTNLSVFKISSYGNVFLENERAPMGNHVRVLGSGFREGDRILVSDYEASTTFISENVLSFQIPLVSPNKTYPVFVACSGEKIFAGNLFIDNNRFSVEPTSISIGTGEKIDLTLHTTAPVSNDVLVNVTTSIPNSVIMPEIHLSAGEESTTVSVEGGESGKGMLYISAQGFNEIAIPVEVTGEAAPEESPSEEEQPQD